MQGDIAMHLHREVLALPIFSQASQGCLKAIAMQIKPMFCAPGEYVIHKADAINCIYFVCNGSLEILKDGMVVAILGLYSRVAVFDHTRALYCTSPSPSPFISDSRIFGPRPRNGSPMATNVVLV